MGAVADLAGFRTAVSVTQSESEAQTKTPVTETAVTVGVVSPKPQPDIEAAHTSEAVKPPVPAANEPLDKTMGVAVVSFIAIAMFQLVINVLLCGAGSPAVNALGYVEIGPLHTLFASILPYKPYGTGIINPMACALWILNTRLFGLLPTFVAFMGAGIATQVASLDAAKDLSTALLSPSAFQRLVRATNDEGSTLPSGFVAAPQSGLMNELLDTGLFADAGHVATISLVFTAIIPLLARLPSLIADMIRPLVPAQAINNKLGGVFDFAAESIHWINTRGSRGGSMTGTGPILASSDSSATTQPQPPLTQTPIQAQAHDQAKEMDVKTQPLATQTAVNFMKFLGIVVLGTLCYGYTGSFFMNEPFVPGAVLGQTDPIVAFSSNGVQLSLSKVCAATVEHVRFNAVCLTIAMHFVSHIVRNVIVGK